MSEPDSTPRRRPPTIDLTAKEVVTEQKPPGAEAEAGSDSLNAARASSGSDSGNGARDVGPYALGAAVGALAAVAIVGGVWLAGFLPARHVASAAADDGTPAARAAAISSRLDKIEAALHAPRSDNTLAALASAQAETKTLGAAVTALTRRVDDVAATSAEALAQAKAAAAAAAAGHDAAENSVERRDIEALNSRIAVLEETVKSLAGELARKTSRADDRAARATVAAEALRAAVERGAPYQAELAAVESFGADQKATMALAPFAADGIPDARTLGGELAALVPLLQRTSRSDAEAGSFFSRLKSQAQNLVRVTPVDAPAPPVDETPRSLLARIGNDAARNDVAAALADIARLPDAARAPTAAWVKKAQAREAAIDASRRIAAAALAALSGPAPQ